jgi:hypothetical protein
VAHQIDESKPKYLSQTRFMSGRRIIKTSVTEITDENVVDVLRKALATHELNRSEIDYSNSSLCDLVSHDRAVRK